MHLIISPSLAPPVEPAEWSCSPHDHHSCACAVQTCWISEQHAPPSDPVHISVCTTWSSSLLILYIHTLQAPVSSIHLFGIGITHGLSNPLSLIIAGTRSYRVDMAPVSLLLRVLLWVYTHIHNAAASHCTFVTYTTLHLHTNGKQMPHNILISIMLPVYTFTTSSLFTFLITSALTLREP